jgi:hypothetical protein
MFTPTISLPLDLMASGTVLAMDSTLAAGAADELDAGELDSVFLVQPDSANAPLAATTTAMRHAVPRRV